MSVDSVVGRHKSDLASRRRSDTLKNQAKNRMDLCIYEQKRGLVTARQLTTDIT